MKNITKNINRMFMLGLFASLSLGFSQLAAAATSGQATIHNAVTVTYTSGAQTLTATDTVNVTVLTLASAPNVVAPAAPAPVAAGATVSLTYTVTATANGPDTYTPTLPVVANDANVSAAAGTVITGSPLNLWAGITLGSAAGTITIPAGSEVGITAGVTIVNIAGNQYTVASVVGVGGNPIAIATTDAAGNTTVENSAVLTLTPIGAAPAITAALGAAIQVGEVGTFTLNFTAGTPGTPGTDGTHTVPVVDVVTTATIADNATTATGTSGSTVVVTVSSPALTITKLSRNVTTGVVVFGSGTTAKPGEVIEYQITVTNTHATVSATLVRISDVIPVYTDIVTGAYNAAASEVSITETIAGIPAATTFATAAIDADVAEVQVAGATSTLVVNIGGTAGDAASAANGGTILGSAALENVVILFQVTVQ